MKFLLSLIVEIAILYFVLQFLVSRWIIPEINYGGTGAVFAQLGLIIIFGIDAALYALIRLANAIKSGELLHKYKTSRFVLVLFTVPLFFLLALAALSLMSESSRDKAAAILYLTPLILFALRHLFLKLLASKK